MNGLAAVLAFEEAGVRLGYLLLRRLVEQAARAAKMDRRLGAVAHSDSMTS